MAKNLKINVKNAQLAKALNLGAIKKPAAKKKKSAKTEEDKPVEPVKQEEATLLSTQEKPKSPPERPLEDTSSLPPTPTISEKITTVEPVQKKPSVTPEHPSTRSASASETAHEPSNRGSNFRQYERPQTRSYDHRGPQRNYPPRREGSGFTSAHDGYSPRPQGNYPPRQQGSGYPPRREGGGYPPRREGGYPPRREGGYSQSPRPGYTSSSREGAPAHPGGGYRPGGSPPFRRPTTGFTPASRPPYPPRPRPFQPGQAGTSSPDGYRSSPLRKGPALPESGKSDRKSRDFEAEPRKPVQKEFRELKPVKKQEERSFDARDRQGLRGESEDLVWRKKRIAHKTRLIQQEEIIRPKNLSVRIPITVKDLAAEMKLKASQLISKLFMKGVVLTLNDFLDDETTIQLLGQDFDCEITIDRVEEDRLRITDKTIKQEIQDSPVEQLVLRAPVVAFMGHVDHGKTSLIDRIRTSDIAGGEAGAITQHIGAFKCHTAVGDITILDTPGHEAFSAMRSRGADVTDIIVLVIAGDEGIRTQTIEAITQAQTANVPILVALNKCDKPSFNADNVYRQLSEHNLLPEQWGGQTITINCSATTGEGVKELLEMLALQAEVLELKANPQYRARGTVIESEMHKGMGAVATILVQNGTLRLGDALVFAQQFARVKTMHNEHDRELTEAGPSSPVKITGLSDLPEAGSEFIVVKSEKEAMEIAEKRSEGQRHALLHQSKRAAESFLAEKATGVRKKILNLIIRADVQGSVEALKNSLLKIVSNKISLNIISAAVGEISESDVQLASASKAIILGFHTQVESHAESLIKSLKVNIKLHDIIYHAVDDIRALMLSMLDKVAQETDIGSAEVKATFKSSQLGVIAGCSIIDGIIKRSSHIRQLRDNQVIWKGPIHSLKRVKEDVKEVSKGYECGIVLHNQNDVKVGDILQAFEITYLAQEL